jgi:AhpD family alkylhydroperoxidase
MTPTPDASGPDGLSPSVRELIALGASIASNCEPCFRYHYNEARKLGVSKQDMTQAVSIAQAVKDTPARAVLALAERYLKGNVGEAPNDGDSGDDAVAACCAAATGSTAEAAATSTSGETAASTGCCG